MRVELGRTVAEKIERVEECHFLEADPHAETAGFHFVRACLEAAPMHAAGYVDLVVHCLPVAEPVGPAGPVVPAVVLAEWRGTAVGAGNFAVGHAAFAAEDASWAAFPGSLALQPFEQR